MKPETMQEIQKILRRVVVCAIPIRWRSNSAMPGSGERRSFFRGSGHEFDALDEYKPGDDPRKINWRATAKTGGHVILKNVFLEQRDIKVFILADVSRSMDFGTFRATKRFLAAELAASICKSADETADRVGFMAYSDTRLEKRVPSRAAKRALLPALVNILETQGTGEGSGSGLVKALSALPVNRSLVFVLSDFQRLTEEDKAALKRAALKHDVVCLVIQDLRERELPPGWGYVTYQDLETGERVTVKLSKANRAKVREMFQRQQEALTAFFKQVHASWLVVSTEEGDAAIPKIMKLFASHKR